MQHYEPDLLTVWLSPGDMLQTQYGHIQYIVWCALEVLRIGGDAKVVSRIGSSGLEVCIWKKGAGVDPEREETSHDY